MSFGAHMKHARSKLFVCLVCVREYVLYVFEVFIENSLWMLVRLNCSLNKIATYLGFFQNTFLKT